nr:hypothetical protein BHI3_24470 [Bacteriovorax sp. HI3]
MKKMLMVLSLISLSVKAADNNMLFIGGGGEPKGAQGTQFDGSVRALGDFYKANKNYSTTISFNGGHPDTESLIADRFKGAANSGPFTSSNYKALIEDAIKKIENKDIPAGGKLLVFINSHGGESSGKTHNISTAGSAMTNMNSLNDTSSVSLDTLEALTKAAKDNNIKLAIVDGSCHAGNSLSLANANTCVIAASGPKHYAYSNFADVFAAQMKKGKNLEDIFFETKAQTQGGGFPMISTPEGVEVQDEIYPYLTPYMYYHDEYRGMALDKIDDYIKDNMTDELICRREAHYDSLKKVLNLIEEMNQIEKKTLFSSKPRLVKTVDLTDLKKKIDEYKKTQDNYFAKLRRLDLAGLETKITITTDYYKKGTTYTHREVLSTDYDQLIAGKTKDLENTNLTPARRENLENLRDFYRAARIEKAKLIRDNPQYLEQRNIFDELKTDQKVGYSVASAISQEASKAYDAYYKSKQKELKQYDQSATNPCRDFIL